MFSSTLLFALLCAVLYTLKLYGQSAERGTVLKVADCVLGQFVSDERTYVDIAGCGAASLLFNLIVQCRCPC